MKTNIIKFISVLVIFYLIGCFISTSFNIKNWCVILRIFVAIFGVLFGAVFIEVIDTNKKI